MAFTGTTAQEFIDFVTDAVVDLTSFNGQTFPEGGGGLNVVINSAFSDDQAVLSEIAKELIYKGHERLGDEATSFTSLLSDKAEAPKLPPHMRDDVWNAEKQAQFDAIITPENLYAVIKHANSQGSKPTIGGFGSPTRPNPEYSTRRASIAEDVTPHDDYYSSLEAGETPSLLNVIYNNTAYEFGLDRFSDPAAREQHEATAGLAEFRIKPKFREDLYSPLDFDQNGVVDALTDGLLYMRYLFGLRGDALAEDTIAEDATRTVEEIETYLGEVMDSRESNPALFNALDLDSDGTLDALTDGLMFLRYAFGLTGEPLLDSALAENSQFQQQLDAGLIDRSELQLAVETKIESMMSKIGENRIKVDENNNILVPPDGVTDGGGIDLYTYEAGKKGIDVPEDYEHDYISVNDDGSLDVPEGLSTPTPTPTPTPEPDPVEKAEGPFSPLDIDQNGVVDALTDGLLYLRYAFGLTGDALTSSAIAENANRSPQEAQEYLEYITEEAKNDNPALYDIFDIDGDGNLDALTDGLLLLRYAFGLTGDPLTNSAVAEEAPLALQLESGEITAKEFTDAVEAKLSPYIDGTPEDGEDFISVNDDGSLNVPMSLGGEPTIKDYSDVNSRVQITGLEAAAAEYNLTVAEFVEIYDYNGDGTITSRDVGDYLAYSQGDLDKYPKYVSEQAQTEAAQEVAALQLAKQQALDNYTGDGKLPEGSDESHIQKRLQHWQDNPPAHFSGVQARNTEFNQIKQDYGTELGKLDLSALGIMDLDNDDVPDSADTDKDGDGVVNNVDLFPDDGSETVDSDEDGIGDYADFDDDNDGVLDYEDPRQFDEDIWDVAQLNDSDNDGTNDYEDAFPNDGSETVDSDNDGTGDNADAFPNNASETTDSDNDGTGDNADAFPNDGTETVDSDNDGTGDNADAFPNDGTETVDSDNDGTGDNADAFPNDGTETVDSDNDGTGDNADAFPNDGTETVDSDNDGTGDNADYYPDNADRQQFKDSDGDGVDNRDDPAPDDANITNQEQFNASRATEDEDADADSLGFGELPTKTSADRSGYRQEFYDALRDKNGVVQLFNNGITGGNIFYQGFVIPLTTEQLIDGYYSILETGTWTDPRHGIINDYNAQHNFVNQVRAPIYEDKPVTLADLGKEDIDAFSGMTGNHHAAREFINKYTQGEFSYYDQRGGAPQIVDINYGRDGNGDFITLKDLFENRVPYTGNDGLTRVDRENILPAGFVQGVDRVPEIDELYQFYTDALIYASARNPNIQYAYDYADNVMAGLPEELFNKWKEHTPVKRWDQDDVFLSELKKAVRPADLLGLNHYTEVDTDLLRDYAETISGSGEGGTYRKYFNTVADAIDKFVDDPGSLTAEEKEYLNQYRVAQTDLYLSTDPLDEDEFEVEGTALSDVSRLADYQNAQNFWLDRETKYGDNQGIRDAIEENYDYQFGAWEPDPENPYDRPPEFGMSMISQANGGLQFSNGQAFFGGTNVAVDDVVVWDEDGKGYGRIEWGAYVNSWQQDVNRMGLPAYQETDVLGVDLETSKRFTELATNKDRNEAQEEEYQALAQELSSNTMDLFGDDIPPVWYDASRLYIKTPFHDHAAAEAAGFTSEEIDFSRNRQITNRGFNSGGAYNNQIPSYVEGDSLDYSTFANPGDERNEGHGFFLDITGGDAPVGSYSMVWVSQPEWYEPPDQSFWEFVLNSPIVGIVASIISPMYGNMVVAGLKAASGMTLHASDWLSIGIGALKMSGQLQMPVDPEVANEMATTAAGDALTAAEAAGQTLTELERATLMLETYNSAYDIAITGFGIGTLSAAQTVNLMNVVAYEGDIGTALLGAFGDEYLVKSLSVAGIDISNLPDNVTGWMTEITTEMINGTSFDDAIKLTAGTEFLGYLQDSVEDSKVYATAKNILEEAVEEIDQATQAVQTMANDLGDGIEATISAIGDSMDTDLLAELRAASKNIRTSINSIGESIGNIATELNAEVLTPVTDSIKNNMSKFVTMAGLDNQNLFSISGDSAADADGLMDDIKGFVGDTVFESVPDAIKATLREAAIQKIALGEVDQNELKLMATRGSITIEAVSNLDGDLVEAIGPRILTKALQNTLTAATFGGDPGKAFLDTIADSTVQSIQTAMASGGWPQVVKKFDQFEDDITGKSREAQAAADEYNKIGTDFNALETRQKELDTEHNTAIEEIARLEGLALADGAGDEEMQAYLTYVETYAVRSQAIGAELDQIKTDKDALIAALPAAEEKYDTAVSAVNEESARLDPLLQKEFDNLYVNALVAVHPEIKMAEYATVSGMEWEGEYPTAEEIAEHFLSEGIQNGVPVNIEEYNARRDAGASQYVISALRASGIDATKLTDDERKNITNYLLNEHATVKAEENGQTVVEYLEDFNETPDNFEAGEKALEAAYVLEEGFGTAPEAVALTVANRRANYAFNALGMSAEDVRNIANNDVSYTIDPDTGDIIWGGGGFMMREWNSTTKQFDTYQYDAGGGLKYKLNDDGSEPLVRILERTPMFNGIADLAEDSPASYMTFLATAPTDAAVTAQVNYLSQADRDADELQRIKDIQAAIKDAPEDDGRFAIPDSELPWIVRVARDWLDHSQEVENTLLADIEYLENLEGPLSIDDELRLEFARGAYAVAEGNTEFLATWVVKTPTKIASFMQTSINAFTAWSQGIAAEKKADGFRRQALYEGKSAEEADAIFREKYAEFKQDIDYSSIVHNDANRTHNMMESLARGYLPDSYLADQKEMGENIAAADGALDTVIAITGEIIDKPDVFLGTYIAEELPTAIFGLGLGSAAGRLTSLAAAKVVGKEAAESLATGSTVSMGASRVADLSEAFGETAYATYEEAKQELERIGYEGDIEAKAQEIAIKAGTTAMVLVGATAPFGAFALDNAILNASTKKAVKEVAQRVEGLGDTLTKETVTEVIQGGFTQGATEVFLYNAGVTDRDVAGNIAGSATLEGLVGGTTAGIITGLSTPTDTGTGFDGGDPFASLLFSNPDIKGAVEAGDATQVQALLGERNLTDTPLYVEVMNTVDDANYVTPTEVRQAFGYLGVQPTGDEVVALTNKEGITDATLEAEAEAYWAETYGEELLGTGRTTAQHYDIIQHMTDMINGVVPLDSSFNMNGDTTLDQADIDTYIAKLPLREQNLYNQYDPTDHEPTGIIEDLGGSLMNIADMDKLKQDIQTILDRGDPVTAQEVVDMLLQDPTNKAILKGQIEAAVGNEFAKVGNQNAFAGTVVDKLVEDGTIKTQSKDAVKELFGDPAGNTVEEQGVFGIIEGLKNMLDLGESDATTLAGYISDKIGTAVELDDEGKIKDGTGSGLLGTLTRNGVLRDVAIAEISNVLGSAGDGTEADPATGIYAIANDAADTKAAVARIEADYGTLDTEYTALKSLYDTAITNMQTNLGSPGIADDPETEDVDEYRSPTGLYALVGKAIAAGDGAKSAVTALLGGYVDFAAFEDALELTMKGKVDEVVTAFGTPPVYETEDDGTIKRDDAGEPIIKTGATGYHLDMYNAMQLQGVEQDLAFTALNGKINAALTQVEQVSSAATADTIKTNILNEYFPAKPEDYEVGRAIATELDYVQSLIASGQFDANYDRVGDTNVITREDYDDLLSNATPEQITALENYNTWSSNTTAISPMLEAITRETGTNFAIIDRRIDSVTSNVNDYIRDNVLKVIGKPKDIVAGTDASGIYGAIEAGDTSILDVLGELGTIEDGVLTGGDGILRDMQLLGMDTTAINDYLINTLGKPADGGTPASGIFAAVDANQTTLNDIETWFTGTINALNEVVPDLATEDDKITSQDIKDAVGSMLGDVLLGTELTNKADVSTAVNELIGSTAEFDRKTELEGKDTLEEGEAKELEALQDKIYLATEEDKLTVGDIKDQLIEDLGSIITKGELISADNISAAVDLAFGEGEGLIDYATSTDVISETAIAEQLQKSLGDVLLGTEVVDATNIANAVDLAIGTSGQRLRKEALEAKDTLTPGEETELANLQNKVYLAFPTDQLSESDIKDQIVTSILEGGYLQVGDLIGTSDIATAVTSAIGSAEGQVNLAKEGDKIKPTAIQAEIVDGLKPYLRANQLTDADDISNAVNAVLGTTADAERRDELAAQDTLNDDETAELALLQGKVYLATSDDQLTVGDIKDQLILDLGNIVTTGELVNADNISAAVDLAFGEGEGLIDYATSTDVMTETAIAEQLQKSLGDVLLGTEVVDATNIANAVDLAIGTSGQRLRKEALEAKDTLTPGEETELANLQNKVYLAFPTDQLSESDIKDQIVTSILEGGYLQVGDLIGTSDIATAVTSAIGSAEGQVNLAKEGDKIKPTAIQAEIVDGLKPYLRANQLTDADDISNAVNAVLGTTADAERRDELAAQAELDGDETTELAALQNKVYLATSDDQLTVGDIKDQLILDLGNVVTTGQLVNADNISAAVDLAFGEGEGLIDYATSTDVMTETAIAEQLQKSLGNVLLGTEVVDATNIANAVDLAIGTSGQRLRKEALEAKDTLTPGEETELANLQNKVYLAFPTDQLSESDIKGQIVTSILEGGYLQVGDLIGTSDIATAVTSAIGSAEGQVNLAKEGDKIKPAAIQAEIVDGLKPYLRANQLTDADDISNAVNAVLGTTADAERRDELAAQDTLNDDETTELAALQNKVYLATSDDQLTVGDIKDQLILDLGNIVTTGQLVNADNISAAVDLAFGEGEGLIDYATSTDVMTETAIAEQLQKSLGDVLLGTEVVDATNIANAVDLAIGTSGQRLRKEALEAKDTLTPGEETELANLQNKVYLAFPTDQLSESDIKGQIVTSILEGGYLQVGDLIGTSDIATAVTSAIGKAEGQVNLAKEGDKITPKQIKDEIIAGLDPYLRADQLTDADDISSAVNAVLGTTEDAARRDELLAQDTLNDDETTELAALQNKVYLATLGTQIQPEAIRSAVKNELSGVLTTDQLITAENIGTAVDSVIGTSEDQAELDRLGQLETRDDSEQAEFERLSSLLYLATPDDVLSAEELATAVQTDELKNVATVDDLLKAGDISGAVNAAIGEDGLNLATKGDVLDPDEVAAAVTTQLGNMIASGETVSAATIQDAIANQTVAIGQVVSAEQAGLATTEQLTTATQDLATSDDIQMLADLIGKPVNEVTQEDYTLAEGYLQAIEDEQAVADAEALRYDVTGDGQLTQQDLDLLGGALDTGDYSQFAGTAQFRDVATGMLGREDQLEAELAARDAQIEADKIAQTQRDQDLRTQIQTDFETSRIEREAQEEQDKLFEAMQAPGRKVTTRTPDPVQIDEIYDFESIFRGGQQDAFYGSASMYGDNFLEDIINPQQRRAKGGIIKDQTDEILRIMGDK